MGRSSNSQMGPLPTVIAVKRKADEAALDVLYVQDGGPNSRKRFPNYSFKFMRIKDDENVNPSTALSVDLAARSSKQSNAFDKAASERRPSEDLADQDQHQPAQSRSHKAVNPKANHLLAAARAGIRSRSSSPRPRREPRKFHWTKEQASGVNYQQLSLRHGIQKRPRTRLNQLAVFTEQKHVPPQQLKPNHKASSSLSKDITESAGGETPASRKKPGATPQERAWRKESWSKASVRTRSPSPLPAAKTNTSLTDDEDSLALAASLREFALQATGAASLAPPPPPSIIAPANGAAAISLNNNQEEHETEEAEKEEEGGPWVYDQYVCYTIGTEPAEDQSLIKPSPTNALTPEGGALIHARHEDDKNYGVIIIDDDDEMLWKEYCETHIGGGGSDDEEDRYGTDDEDENAEDHYTHDYPDEEEDSTSLVGSDHSLFRGDDNDNDAGSDVYDGYHGDGRSHDEIGFSDEEENGMGWRGRGFVAGGDEEDGMDES